MLTSNPRIGIDSTRTCERDTAAADQNDVATPLVAGAFDRLDGGVECLQKTRAILFGERASTASNFTGFSKFGHQITGGERVADAVFGEGMAAWANGSRTLLDATRCKRDIGGDGDIACAYMVCDPIIGHVKAVGDRDIVILGWSGTRIQLFATTSTFRS